MKKQLLLFLFAIVASVGTMFAEKVQIGDLYYNLKEDKTAEVTSGDYSGLTTANIPASVTYSGTTYSVTSIGDYAFSGCSSLTSIGIPNSVTSIGEYAFLWCSSLTSLSVEAGNTVYDSRNNCNAIIETSTNTLIVGCQNTTIPNSVTSIGNYAFCSCSSRFCVMGVCTENNAFSGCSSWTSMTIPNSVTSIGDRAFDGCSSLTSVTIGNSVTSIGEGAFGHCSGLTSVTIGNSVTSIGDYAFSGCSSLTSVTIPNSVTSIGSSAFSGCSGLTSVTIPNSVTSIGDYVFSGCSSLTSVTIPNSIISIGRGAFQECGGLTSVTIPNSVTNIREGAFYYCSGLASVTLGTSVKVIEEYAFGGCTAIESITCYSMRPPTVNNDAFENLDYSTIIYVPADYLNYYKVHDSWGLFDVRPIGASKTETTEVKVEPTATTADVVWPAVENAATYELVIKDKNGNVVCTLIFNANGQLTQIAFNAPARNNTAQAAGFSFTVTGLEEGTSYDLTITAKDGNGTTLDEKTIAFTTSGGTGVDALQAGELHSSKIMRDGQVLIMRGGKMYNLQGVEVK